MHCQGAKGLRRFIRQFRRRIQDRLRAPYANFCIKSSCSNARAIWVNVDGEYGEWFGGIALRGRVFVLHPGWFREVHSSRSIIGTDLQSNRRVVVQS